MKFINFCRKFAVNYHVNFSGDLNDRFGGMYERKVSKKQLMMSLRLIVV